MSHSPLEAQQQACYPKTARPHRKRAIHPEATHGGSPHGGEALGVEASQAELEVLAPNVPPRVEEPHQVARVRIPGALSCPLPKIAESTGLSDPVLSRPAPTVRGAYRLL